MGDKKNMNRWKGRMFLLLAFTLAGTSVISAKILSDKLGTFTITAVSLVFAILLLLPLCGREAGRTAARHNAEEDRTDRHSGRDRHFFVQNVSCLRPAPHERG